MNYSDALTMSYQYYPSLDQIIFEDGVCYTMREALILSKLKSSIDIKALHAIKKVFGAELLYEKDCTSPEDIDKAWFELEPPSLEPDPTPIVVKRTKRPPVLDAEKITLDL